MLSSDSPGHQACMQYTYIYVGTAFTYRKIKYINLKDFLKKITLNKIGML